MKIAQVCFNFQLQTVRMCFDTYDFDSTRLLESLLELSNLCVLSFCFLSIFSLIYFYWQVFIFYKHFGVFGQVFCVFYACTLITYDTN